MDDLLTVYMTAPDRETAKDIARTLVEAQLAACANILPGVLSLYRWEGRMEEAEECAMILKTSAACWERLQDVARGRHPYACPCIVGLPITHGTNDYLTWIRESLTPEG